MPQRFNYVDFATDLIAPAPYTPTPSFPPPALTPLRKLIAQIAADAMQHANQPLVPQIVLGGERGTSGVVDLLMAMSLANGTVGAALRPAERSQAGG